MGHRTGCLLWGTEQGVMGHRAGCLLWGTGQGVCYGAQSRVFVMGHRTGCYGAQDRVLWGTGQGVCYGAQSRVFVMGHRTGCYGAQMERVLWGTGQGVMGHRVGCLLWGTEQGVCYGAQSRVLWGTEQGVMGHRKGVCYGAQDRVFVMGHRAGCLLWGTEQGVMGHRKGVCYGAQDRVFVMGHRRGCLLWGTEQGVCYGAQSRVLWGTGQGVMGHRAGCLLWGTEQAGCYGAQMEREGRSRGQWWRAPGRAVLDGRGEDPWAVQGCARPAGKGSGWPSTAMCGWDMAAELCPAPVSLWVSPFHTCALLPRPPSPVLSAGAPRGAGTRPAAKSSLPTTVLESPSLGDSKPTWPRP
ncbi:uncharacterized protein LOC131082093 isoform X31 [Melospiza georgiana]|uniref:uncharacterized protein LOC131082093 isoform X31 n=1 Tax=Melospiza georgiana TaxID=44398 RepID=UPI0025AD3FBF|nr:uncharacterized protein LOC131082093 isoform X31 [Melospiza georgiana]